MSTTSSLAATRSHRSRSIGYERGIGFESLRPSRFIEGRQPLRAQAVASCDLDCSSRSMKLADTRQTDNANAFKIWAQVSEVRIPDGVSARQAEADEAIANGHNPAFLMRVRKLGFVACASRNARMRSATSSVRPFRCPISRRSLRRVIATS